METVNCVCGKQSSPKYMESGRCPNMWIVTCEDETCWMGRVCDTEKEAVSEWNSLMGLPRLFSKSLLNSLYGKFAESPGS